MVLCKSALVLLWKRPYFIVYQQVPNSGHPPVYQEGGLFMGLLLFIARRKSGCISGGIAAAWADLFAHLQGLVPCMSLSQEDPTSALVALLPSGC